MENNTTYEKYYKVLLNAVSRMNNLADGKDLREIIPRTEWRRLTLQFFGTSVMKLTSAYTATVIISSPQSLLLTARQKSILRSKCRRDRHKATVAEYCACPGKALRRDG